MSFQIKKATKQQLKLKIALQGPSGSGKTLGALALAHSLSPSGKVCVIDTEHGSASLYADKYSFDVIDLLPPYTSKRYQEAMDAAAEAGYEVLVVDSITHQWDGEGGILDRKAELDKRPGSNSYTNWQSFTPEHTHFLEHILKTPMHVVTTMRSKSEYVLETNKNGKQQPRKVGMAPIQRDGVEFEFTVVFDIQLDHKATVTKDRTALYGERIVDLLDPAVGKELLTWMASGEVVPAVVHTQKPSVVVNGAVELRKASDVIQGEVADVTRNEKGLWLKVAGRTLLARPEIEERLVNSLGKDAHLLTSKVDGHSYLIIHNVASLTDPILPEAVQAPDETQLLTVDGKLRISGTVTAVYPSKDKKPFGVKLGNESLSSWHATHAELLKDSKGQRVVLEYTVKDGKYKNIADVLRIGDKEYEKGVPVLDINADMAVLLA